LISQLALTGWWHQGSQRYPIPAGVDLKSYPSVVIWCERFSVLISPADRSAAAAR
jgi:hypothetical protein